MSKKILILHDYFLYKGGGERLIISLAKNLNADVATAFIAKDAFDPREHGIKTFELFRESVLSRLPGFRYLQVQFAFLLKTKFIENYDIIFYSGDCLIAQLRAKGKINIAYMHTPPRHLFDRYEETLDSYGIIKKLLFIPFVWFNRWRFVALSRRLTKIITNSQNTKKRIQQYLQLDADVVYPPCNTLDFSNIVQGDYFFSWARLYGIKRVDKIVEAFTKMPDKKLVVASSGPELDKINKIASGHSNIRILGWISDTELLEYLGKCLATIYIPVREDFGMSAVESMTAEKPVIGVAEGGLLEIIYDGVNGYLLKPDFTVDDLCDAVRKMTPSTAGGMAHACRETASRFSEQAFANGIRGVVRSLGSDI